MGWNENDERELEADLRRALDADPADPAFRERLRARFVEEAPISSSRAAEVGRSAPDSMSLESALRRLEVPPARAEFRSELRTAFLAGPSGVAEPAEEAAREPAPEPTRELAPARRRPRRDGHPLSSGPLSWQVVTGLVAAAAAIVLLLWVPTEEPEPELAPGMPWSVAARGPGLRIDGERIAAHETARLASAVRRARSIATADDERALLKLASDVRFGLEERSTIQLPSASDGDGSEELEFYLSSGSVHLETRDGYAGATIVVETPHSRVRVRASAVSVDVFDGKGTCICVAEGEAEVEILEGAQPIVRVAAGDTCFVFDGDRAVVHGPSSDTVDPEHLRPLEEFLLEEF